MFSVADILQIALVCMMVMLWQYSGYFLFWKRVKCSTILTRSATKQLSYCNLVPRASRLPSLFLSISCTIDVFLLNNANVLQIWSTLAGYEELPVAGRFEPFNNGEIF